jgi:twitching motility protein PilT
MDIVEILKAMVEAKASDLHLKVPGSPVLRINGVLTTLDKFGPCTPKDMEGLFEQVTSPDQRSIFAREKELDCSYSLPGLARFRVNVVQQRGTLAMAFRLIPFKVASIDELGLPPFCKELILKSKGLILITGPTGCGKSTTMASLISYLNENNRRTVMTVEDPIEYLYRDQKCLIAQRDLGDDTHSFAKALKSALRHDPEVLIVGELRDLETIGIALTAAETGHLVLGTVHTIDATQTIERIIDVFPQEQKNQIRMQVADVLEGVISQRLLPRIGGGRVAAFEIMLPNSVIRRLILESKLQDILTNMEASNLSGMQTMDQSLVKLLEMKLITMEDAIAKCSNRSALDRFIKRSEGDVWS